MRKLLKLLGLSGTPDGTINAPSAPEPVSGDIKRCVVFVGGVRTGTTVFRQMLGTHPRITDRFEIFNSNTPHGFYPFYREHLKRHPEAVFPEQNRDTLASYLRQLCTGDELELVDIKYEHLGHLPAPWRMPFSPPAMLEHVRDLELKVIHLRRSPFHSLLSNEVATQTRRYKRLPGENQVHEADEATVWVDRRKLEADIRERRQVTRMVDDMIPEERRLSFDYENMLDVQGAFEASMCAEIARFLGVEDSFDRQPGLEKVIARPLSEVIKNYGDIADLEHAV